MYNQQVIVKDICRTLAIELSEERINKLQAYIMNKELPIDTIQELVIQEFNNVGPQGTSIVLRVTELDNKRYQTLMMQLKDPTYRSPKKQIFKAGLRLALLKNVGIPDERGRLLKITVNFDIEMQYLIRRVIAKYSNEAIEISGATALIIALQAISEEYNI